MKFKLNKEIKDKFKNIPEDFLKSLEWLKTKKADELLQILSEDNFESYDEKDEINDLDKLFYSYSLDEIAKILKNEKWINIYIWEKKEESESWNKWYIAIFSKTHKLIWEIWTDLYNLWNEEYIDSHLWIEVNPEFQWQNFWNILYKLYFKVAEENWEFFLPIEEFANTNSRILLLIKMWYSLKSKYNLWEFIELSKENKYKIIKDAQKNYYDKQVYDYKFIYTW